MEGIVVLKHAYHHTIINLFFGLWPLPLYTLHLAFEFTDHYFLVLHLSSLVVDLTLEGGHDLGLFGLVEDGRGISEEVW